VRHGDRIHEEVLSMTPSRLVSLLALSCGLGSVSCVVYRVPPPQHAQGATAAAAPAADAQAAAPAPEGAAPPVTEPPVPAAPEAAPSLPGGDGFGGPDVPAPVATAKPPERSDHDQVVGHWGIEARNIGGDFVPTNQGRSCAGGCPATTLTSLGVRRWVSAHYAWNLGLVLGVQGGSTGGKSWDTFLGLGPTLGANFVLSTWKHFTVSANPQLEYVYFAPSSSAAKTHVFNARALVEGELQLGFIGLPAVSVGLAPGLVFHLQNTTQSTESVWSISTTGQQTLWGLVTNGFIRFYL
jgi:hypothetical protein